MPLWLKWVLSLLVAVGLITALVVYVGSNPLGDQSTNPALNPPAAAQANREGQIVTAQDQLPHHAALPRSLAPRVALERAIAAVMRTRAATAELAGPVQRVTCTQLAPRKATSLVFRCHALAGGSSYPSDGVVDLSTRELTWCRDDRLLVDPGLRVPLSAACTRSDH